MRKVEGAPISISDEEVVKRAEGYFFTNMRLGASRLDMPQLAQWSFLRMLGQNPPLREFVKYYTEITDYGKKKPRLRIVPLDDDFIEKVIRTAEIELKGKKPKGFWEARKIVLGLRRTTIDIDLPVGSSPGSNFTIKDTLAAQNSTEDEAAVNILGCDVKEMLEGLPKREREVLEDRYGLEDGRTKTLEEVGKKFGVTRERVRQIEAKAFRRLRTYAFARKFGQTLRPRETGEHNYLSRKRRNSPTE